MEILLYYYKLGVAIICAVLGLCESSVAVMIISVTAPPLALAAYFLPSIVSGRRGHPYERPILVFNLLFGWTLIGWGLALVAASMPSNQGWRAYREERDQRRAERAKAFDQGAAKWFLFLGRMARRIRS